MQRLLRSLTHRTRQRILPGFLLALGLTISDAQAQDMPDALAQAHIQRALSDIKTGHQDKAESRFRWLLMSDRASPDRTARYLHALALLSRERPLRFAARANLTPSSNLQRDSSEDSFLIFPLDDPESGTSFSLGTTMTATHAYRDGRALSGALSLDGTLATAEELDNSRLALSLNHDWLTAGRTTRLSLTHGQRRYKDLASRSSTPDYDEWSLGLSTSRWRDGGVRLSYAVSLSQRDYEERDYMDGLTGRLSAAYSKPLADLGRLTLRGSLAQADVEKDHYSYQELELGLSFARHEKNGLGWELGLARSWRDYEDDFAPLDVPREDRSNAISFGLSHDKLKLRDMTPRLSCTFSDQSSNVALYTFDSLDCSATLRHDF
jgi:Protein of unknown function (DUF560).